MPIRPNQAATIVILSLSLLTMLFPVTLALADEGHGDGIELTEPVPEPAPLPAGDPTETVESTEMVEPTMSESHAEDADSMDDPPKSADNPDSDKMKEMGEEDAPAPGGEAEMKAADHAGAESYTVNGSQENGYALALGLTLGTIVIFGLAAKFL